MTFPSFTKKGATPRKDEAKTIQTTTITASSASAGAESKSKGLRFAPETNEKKNISSSDAIPAKPEMSPQHPASADTRASNSGRRVSFVASQGSMEALLAPESESSCANQLQALIKSCALCIPGPRMSERRNSLPKDATNIPLAEPRISSDKESELSAEMITKVKVLFEKLDANGDGTITKSEAQAFWKANWSKVNAQAMFNEVDDDADGEVTYDKWLEFWRNVVAQEEYNQEDVVEEVDNMIKGGSWVDWNDGRTT